jgi:hypothetical protein
MADNATGLNAQYDGEFFPGIRAMGNRAPGSAGDSAAETTGEVVGSPVVLPGPYASSQVPASLARVDVTAGDTSSMSSDEAAQASVISPGPAASYTSTGAGSGSGAHFPRRPGQQPNGG